ncbi:MAG: VOC family protein [Ilumatobacteraceae bacterium]|nr:VOC family protein [Planctomycetales bacterium]
MGEQYAIGPKTPRWTHIALPAHDMDASIAWYEKHTPLRLLERREDADGYGAWLGVPEATDHPFILVLVSFFRDQPNGPQPIMAPFAHIGIEVPERADVDAAAEAARADGCLHWEPTQMPPPIGYICAIKDPDGNVIEISWDQGVYAKAREVWG